jgi:GINS complex subunit 4
VRAWACERAAPDLLPWLAKLMQHVMQRVREQISHIEDMSGGGAGYQGPAGEGGGNQNLNLALSILQTDLLRTQFVVRSLLRLIKILGSTTCLGLILSSPLLVRL